MTGVQTCALPICNAFFSTKTFLERPLLPTVRSLAMLPSFVFLFTLFTLVASFRAHSVAIRHHTRHAMTRRALELNDSDKFTFLEDHNNLRSAHNAAPLTWSSMLASKAASWADRCIVRHSEGTLMESPYGETVVAATGKFTIHDALVTMSRTREQYNPATSYSQYTQLVWKNTREVGCAISRCEGILSRPVTLYTCLYFPAGNLVGELAQNVEG